jgi:hypothetical protein
MPHVRKLQAHTEQPEALKKALESARNEKARKVAHQTVDALTAVNKKAFKVKHVRRSQGASSVY